MIVKDGFLARRTTGFRSPRKGRVRRESEAKRNYRDWWLVKHSNDNENDKIGAGWIYLGGGIKLSLPSSMIGKRIRFKMEEVTK
jgi:hypothetical protein